MSNTTKKYTVWVGGVEVNDHLLTESEGSETRDHYIKLGYDDVVLEQVI